MLSVAEVGATGGVSYDHDNKHFALHSLRYNISKSTISKKKQYLRWLSPPANFRAGDPESEAIRDRIETTGN
ncbi:hypothetical protein DDV96_04080 [Marixanthomonas spongiae]|uniref:Uncharacterized protein n=1 Tax=Marixanthomonas spongiae TaxID=2174845 RepID=A0A2U0I5V1_9FLAO|nr:hypothetical protein DDV96_04080 [Marixanthomonas spongiae]